MNSWQLTFVVFLFLPIVNALITILVPPLKQFVRTSAVLMSGLTLILLIRLSFQSAVEQFKWTWLSVGNKQVNLVFELNQVTIPLAIAVSAVSLLVHIHSVGFFRWDKNQPRYFATLSVFTFSMLGLTLSGNLLQTFVFWELVGLTSYLLIGFYRTKPEAAAAGTKALIMNKIGDAGFIVALMAIFIQSNSLEISELEKLSTGSYSSIIGVGLLLAAFSKSAQFPFQSWLPDAMEGPTPVSALIHSATMVAAGIFLLIRLHFLFTPELLQVMLLTGAFTAILGGVRALHENDLKRLLAWSTVSQFGMMVMIVGLGGNGEAYTHLISHAIFKSGLFLFAGIIISSADTNILSEIKKSNTSLLLTISSTILIFSLMGLPLTIGFLSKEYLISSVDTTMHRVAFFVIEIISIFYATRMLAILYPVKKSKNVKLESIFMIVPVAALAIGSVWILYSPSPFSAQWINQGWEVKAPPIGLSLFNLAWVLTWFIVAVTLIRQDKLDTIVKGIPGIQANNFWQLYMVRPILFATHVTDQLDNRIIDRGIHRFVYVNFSIALIAKWVDNNCVEGLVRSFGWLIRTIGNVLRQFVAGRIQGYIWWTLVTLAILFIISRY